MQNIRNYIILLVLMISIQYNTSLVQTDSNSFVEYQIVGNSNSIPTISRKLSDHQFKVEVIQLTQTGVPNYQLNNTVLTEPLILTDCPNAQIVNVTIENITTTGLSAIYLDNCSNAIIQNVTVQRITATNSYVSGITVFGSDASTIINCTIKDIISLASDFFSSKKAYGILVNDSLNVDISDVIMENITAISDSYGVFSENSEFLFVNDSFISNLMSKSSSGIVLDNSPDSEIETNVLTDIIASESESLGIFLNKSAHSIILKNEINSISGNSLVSGIEISQTPSVSIINNSINSLISSSFLDRSLGINIRNSNFAIVENNSIDLIEASSSEAVGIAITAGNSPDILNNTIVDISSSSDSAFGIILQNCDSAIISGNIIFNAWSDADTYSIPHNVTETSGIAIKVKSSSSALVSWNIINSTSVWISTDESNSNLIYYKNIIDTIESEIIEFDQPADYSIEETQMNSIKWNVSSTASFYNYSVYRNGVRVKNSTFIFASNFTITYNLESLPIGVSKFVFVLQEESGIIMTDVVIITVYESIPPEFILKPNSTLYYQVGSPYDYLLWWTLDDLNPATYSIYRNGTEIAYGEWNALIPFNVSIGGLSLGVYNLTIIVRDITGNTIRNQVMIYVVPAGVISITRNSASLIVYEIFSESCILNWTVHSVAGGTYSIYRGSNKEEKVTSASFSPEESILYIIPPDILIGTYIYTIEIIDTLGNTAENVITVKVVSKPIIDENNTTRVSFTKPPYTIPPYLSVPEPEFPWSLVIGTLGGLGLAASAFFVLTKRILVPKAIKENRKSLNKARKIKDKEGVANNLHQLGQTFLEMKDYKASIKHNEEALNLFNKLGDKKGQLAALEALGDAYSTLGVEKKP